MSYGVTPNGFVVKPLAAIIDEREQAMVEAFGVGVIQTPQSPLGQINGLLSDMEAALWEMGQITYQSYDPDQAEGTSLDNLARLRLISRASGETDASLARAITNAGKANVRDADFYRAVVNADGVTWARIYANDSGVTDANGMAGHSVAVAAIGGNDEALALIARRFVVPGISSWGNVRVETTIDGFCRSMFLLRPTPVRVRLSIDVYKRPDRNGCPPPPNAAIAQALYTALSGVGRLANGEDVTRHAIATALAGPYPQVEVAAVRAARNTDPFALAPLAIGFTEIADIALADIGINVL